MTRLALRGVLAHKFRLVSTVVAIMLGVGFIAGTLIFTDTLNAAISGVSTDAERGTDAYVRGPVTLGEGAGASHRPVDASLASQIAEVDGVADVAVRLQGFAQLVDANGEPVGDLRSGAQPLGLAWSPSEELNPFELVEGSAPEAPDEVIIDQKSASDADLSVGASTTVLTKGGPQSVHVVGIASFGDADSIAGASSVLFEPATAQQLLGRPGQVDGIAVAAADGVSEEQLVDRVEPVLANDEEAITGAALADESANASSEDMKFFTIFMGVFAAVALVVGAFFIKNTFAILVTQRIRELALLRALGASRGQVRGSVALEALAIGVIASAAGLLAGIGLAKGLQSLFEAFGLALPEGPLVVQGRSMAIAFIVGLVVTLLSALIPARRAARVAPIAALRDVAAEPAGTSKTRVLLGLLLTGVSAAATVVGITAEVLPLVGAGALGAFLGVSVLGPVIARPAARLIGAPLPRLFAVRGRLARENAARNPRRTAATAAALMVGVGLVGSVTTFAASGKDSVVSSFQDEVRSDYTIESGGWTFGGFDPAVADAVADRPEVAVATARRMTTTEVDGSGTELSAWQPDTVGEIFDLGATEGSPADLGRNGLAVSKNYADEHGWSVGTEVLVSFAQTGTQPFTVETVFEHSDWTGALWVSREAFDTYAPDALDTEVWVMGADDTSSEELRSGLASVTEAYPNAELVDREQKEDQVVGDFNTMLGLVYALLGLAIGIALLGIGNTIALSVVERTRELGLLRAVGMSRPDLRSMVRWEAAVIAIFGTMTGLVVGLFLGWVMVFAVAQAGVETVRWVVPFGQLALIVAIAALCGVLAALLPAWRAARLDVLHAITTH